MKNACEKWKDRLMEAALSETPPKDLEVHLQSCTNCSAELEELRARRARLDALLPLVAQEAEPSANFRARVLAAAESAREGRRARPWRVWTLAGATAVVVIALIVGLALPRKNGSAIPGDELATAQRLAEWQAPSDGLLLTPGREILNTTPKLGKSYLNVPMKKNEEK
jgi:anti-sigma factor RsiW